MPTPRSIEKNIIGKTSPSANDDIGLVGTIPNNLSETLMDELAVSKGITPLKSIPAPGLKIVPSVKPIIMAKNVVNKYKTMVLIPIEPRRFGSPIDTTPATREVNIRGTISILINRTNRSPIHFEDWVRSPKINPIIAPRSKAIITLTQSFKSVREPSR